jgi:hypothetical protein
MQDENTYEPVSAFTIKLLALVYFIVFASMPGKIIILISQDGILR